MRATVAPLMCPGWRSRTHVALSWLRFAFEFGVFTCGSSLVGAKWTLADTGLSHPRWFADPPPGSDRPTDLTISHASRQIVLRYPAPAQPHGYSEHKVLAVTIQTAQEYDEAFEQGMYRKSALLQQRRRTRYTRMMASCARGRSLERLRRAGQRQSSLG